MQNSSVIIRMDHSPFTGTNMNHQWAFHHWHLIDIEVWRLISKEEMCHSDLAASDH